MPACAPRATRLRGTYFWLTGHPSRARKLWKKSLRLAAENGLAYDEALACLELGRRSIPDSQEARGSLDRGVQLLGRMALPPAHLEGLEPRMIEGLENGDGPGEGRPARHR